MRTSLTSSNAVWKRDDKSNQAPRGDHRMPRWKGPRTKRGAYATRSAIGIPYEMYSPIVAMLVAALNATELPRLGRPRMKLSVHASHTSMMVSVEAEKGRTRGAHRCGWATCA